MSINTARTLRPGTTNADTTHAMHLPEHVRKSLKTSSIWPHLSEHAQQELITEVEMRDDWIKSGFDPTTQPGYVWNMNLKDY